MAVQEDDGRPVAAVSRAQLDAVTDSDPVELEALEEAHPVILPDLGLRRADGRSAGTAR
jgi:hypothetical protein